MTEPRLFAEFEASGSTYQELSIEAQHLASLLGLPVEALRIEIGPLTTEERFLTDGQTYKVTWVADVKVYIGAKDA